MNNRDNKHYSMMKFFFNSYWLNSKKIVFLTLALLMSNQVFSQNVSPQSINSGGAQVNNNNISLSFTVGELVVISKTDSLGNSLNNGFIAGSTLTIENTQETDLSILDVKVFPNPTSELVNIKINYSKVDQVIVNITDLTGSEVFNEKYLGISNVIGINISSYAIGSYILNLKTIDNQILGSYKIIKHN